MKSKIPKKGETWYYNNYPVIIIKKETDRKDLDNFFLVIAFRDVNTDLRGSDFCQACQIGNHASHSCEDAQLIIDSVIDESGNGDIFWVKESFLREKPLEFLQWEKLIEENKKLKKEIEPNLERLKEIERSEYKLKRLNNDAEEKLKVIEKLKKEVKGYNNEIKKYNDEIKTLEKRVKEWEEKLSKFVASPSDGGSRFENIELD